MKRRPDLVRARWLRGWVGIALGLLGIPGAVAGDEELPPNVIFIMADDMGYGDAGCYGGKHILTPHIDRMAEEGMRFTACYSGAPVCAPARSVLMTGRHTGHTRVRGNFGKTGGVKGLGGGSGRVPLLEEDVTVAEVFREAGYVTGITGKWGLGEPETPGTPLRQGFDEWFGYLNQRRAHSHYPDFLWLNEERFPLTGNTEGRKQQYSHDLFTGFALNFIRRHQDAPFFLYLPYCVPHSRFEAPDFGPYAERPWSPQEKAYAAMITRMDADVGRLLDLLGELDLDERTAVFFCSDNGAADRYDGRFDSSGPLRGRKRDMTEGGLRTPMVVRWPGSIAPGTTNDLPWTFADFLPTAAALARGSVPAECDGQSILPLLRGETPVGWKDRFLYWEFYERGFQQAARWRHWKAIRSAPGRALELYDLEKDLGETSDVAGQHPDVALTFENHLAWARSPSEAWPSALDACVPYEVERRVILESEDPEWLWFQSRPVWIPGEPGRLLVTTQRTRRAVTHGYYDWHDFASLDRGKTWSAPSPIPTLRRERHANGDEAVAGDLWLSWHPLTRSVLATGKTFTFEANGTAENNQRERVSYASWDPVKQRWSASKWLQLPEADHEGNPFIAPNAGCNQPVVLENGEVLLPIRYQKQPDAVNYTTTVVRCVFDGDQLVYREHGSELSLAKGRGLYEPSLVRLEGGYYLTLRADHSAFVTRSRDGLHYEPVREWRFDDGQVLGSYNTQQHWLTHEQALFLIYTRRGADNDAVFRHRAPLFMAQVNPGTLQVMRASERTLFAQEGARLGNFGVCSMGPDESLVVTSEFLGPDHDRAQGPARVLAAKIRWDR